jgi:hypothetical protein
MIGKDLNEQIQEDIKAIETARILLGFLPRDEAIQHLRVAESTRNPIKVGEMEQDELETLQERRQKQYLERWEDAKSGLEDPPIFESGQVDLREIPSTSAVEEHLTEFTEQDLFQQVVSEISDWEFKLVPIKSLVAFQKSVTVTAYDDIPTSEDGWKDVFEYCLPVQGNNYLMEQGVRTSDKSFTGVQFVSRGPNIDVVGPEIERHDSDAHPTHTVKFHVVPRPNFIQVVRFGNRYILKNGYHRSFQLMQAGETHVPALVYTANHFAETGAAKEGAFSRDQLFSNRPPLLFDFDTGVAVDIDQPASNKILRVIAETTNIRR